MHLQQEREIGWTICRIVVVVAGYFMQVYLGIQKEEEEGKKIYTK